jgi:DNA-binding beta-propeller fold protein YncE
MHRLAVLTAVALIASVPVLAPSAHSDGHVRGALRELPGAKGCWVAKRTGGCSVYRLAARFNPAGIALDGVAALIVSPDGRNVYAAANPYTNLIAGFTRARDGALEPIAGRAGCVVVGSPRCEPPIYRQRELSALAISPDGHNLYAAADYRYVQAVQAFARVSGGRLRNARHGISCAGARDRVLGTDRRNRCRLTRALGEPTDLVVGPGGRELYVAADNRVVILRRTRNGGIYAVGCLGSPGERLRKATCQVARAMNSASDVAITPDGRNVYVASSQGLAAFARDARDGTLIQLAGPAGCVAEASTPDCALGRSLARSSEPARGGGSQVAVSPDGRNVYLAARYGIAAFARDPRTGTLTQLPGSSACIAEAPQTGCAPGRALHSIEGLVVSPDGANVYAAAYISRAVAVLQRTASGALRQPAGTSACINSDGSKGCARARAIGAATAVAIDPEGRAVYVSSHDAGLAIFFRR